MAGEPWDPIERDRRYSSAKKDGLTRLLTEGDSWFDYPPHPNIVDWLEAEVTGQSSDSSLTWNIASVVQ